MAKIEIETCIRTSPLDAVIAVAEHIEQAIRDARTTGRKTSREVRVGNRIFAVSEDRVDMRNPSYRRFTVEMVDVI